MQKYLILESQLRHLAHGDLDTACREIQRIVGVQTGDVAGQFFSGFDWDHASVDERQVKLRQYAKTEDAFAGGAYI